MKTIIAATLMLVATSVSADWENIFQNPDLTANYQGHTTASTVSVDPVSAAYSNNSDLFAGLEAGDVTHSDSPSSLDTISRGNPDLECNCI